MKNFSKNSSVQNNKTLANFSAVKLEKKEMKAVKGGGEIIIVEDNSNI